MILREGSDHETRGVCDVVMSPQKNINCRSTRYVGPVVPHCPRTSDTLIFKILFGDTVRQTGHKRCDTRTVPIWSQCGV